MQLTRTLLGSKVDKYLFVEFIVIFKIILGYSASPSEEAPNFGPYGSLQCRAGQIASFPLNAAISNDGLVVAMDIFLYSGGTSTQTIFSIRNTATNYISLRFDYLPNARIFDIYYIPTVPDAPYYLYGGVFAARMEIFQGMHYFINYLLKLRIERWNRVIVEIAKVHNLGGLPGLSSARLRVNKNMNREVFFGSISPLPGNQAVVDGNNAALELCGVSNVVSGTVTPSQSGYFDVVNFVWFQGAHHLSGTPSTSKSLKYLSLLISMEIKLNLAHSEVHFRSTNLSAWSVMMGIF